VPTTKLGVLALKLSNNFQAWKKPINQNVPPAKWGLMVSPGDEDTPAQPWTLFTYDYLANCEGKVTYISDTKQIDQVSLITTLNSAFTRKDPDTRRNAGLFNLAGLDANNQLNPFLGSFTKSAKLVVVNYDNQNYSPPYPPTIDDIAQDDLGLAAIALPDGGPVWNAPYDLNGVPNGDSDGTPLPLLWPNQNYISWGKLNPTSEGLEWIGTRVFVIDPSNVNINLRCFDVTPFFAFEESFCYFCWDTMDRVTDGSLTKGLGGGGPCASGPQCSASGSGKTKIYWTVKFNSASENLGTRNPNVLLLKYYVGIMGIPVEWAFIYGTILDDSSVPSSTTLAFTINGVATYTWKFQTLSDGAVWPIGTLSSSAMSGHGWSPMCGFFTGSASITEYDKSNKMFGGVWCLQ
jgi:hypothetical protein